MENTNSLMSSMKKLRYFLMVLVCGTLAVSCEDKPALYSEQGAIYFGTADTLFSYSFAQHPRKIKDTVFVPVNILGDATAADRHFDVEVLHVSDTAGAVEGVHFELGNGGIIPANATVGSLPVIVYRTPDLEEGKAVRFGIRLKKDENFPAEGISARQKLTINLAYIQKPASWGEFTGSITGYFAGYKDNFGTWTPTKYKLILDALYDVNTDMTVTEFPGSRFSPPVLYNQYVALVRNYIKAKYPGNYGLSGAVLTDPDYNNLPIQVGPANY